MRPCRSHLLQPCEHPVGPCAGDEREQGGYRCSNGRRAVLFSPGESSLERLHGSILVIPATSSYDCSWLSSS